MSIKTFGSSLLVYFKFSTTFTLSIPGTFRTTGIITFFAIARTSSGRLFCAADLPVVAATVANRIPMTACDLIKCLGGPGRTGITARHPPVRHPSLITILYHSLFVIEQPFLAPQAAAVA